MIHSLFRTSPTGSPRNAGPNRPTAAQQAETGQSLTTLARSPSTTAASVLLGQHERAAVQHSQPEDRPAEDFQCRGHGPEELNRYPKRYQTVQTSACYMCLDNPFVTGSGALGSWWFGGSPSSPDSNFLRVVNAFPNRRLSDNTLMTPKIRIAPSCASSPGKSESWCCVKWAVQFFF